MKNEFIIAARRYAIKNGLQSSSVMRYSHLNVISNKQPLNIEDYLKAKYNVSKTKANHKMNDLDFTFLKIILKYHDLLLPYHRV